MPDEFLDNPEVSDQGGSTPAVRSVTSSAIAPNEANRAERSQSRRTNQIAHERIVMLQGEPTP